MTAPQRRCRRILEHALNPLKPLMFYHCDEILATNVRSRLDFLTSKRINHNARSLSWIRMARMTPKMFPDWFASVMQIGARKLCSPLGPGDLRVGHSLSSITCTDSFTFYLREFTFGSATSVSSQPTL